MKSYFVKKHIYLGLQILILSTVGGCAGQKNNAAEPSAKPTEQRTQPSKPTRQSSQPEETEEERMRREQKEAEEAAKKLKEERDRAEAAKKAAEEAAKKELKDAIKAASAEVSKAFTELSDDPFEGKFGEPAALLDAKMYDIFKADDNPKRYEALKQTDEYKALETAYKDFAQSPKIAEVTIRNLEEIYDGIINYKNTPAGGLHATLKKRFDEINNKYLEEIKEIIKALPAKGLTLKTGNQLKITIFMGVPSFSVSVGPNLSVDSPTLGKAHGELPDNLLPDVKGLFDNVKKAEDDFKSLKAELENGKATLKVKINVGDSLGDIFNRLASNFTQSLPAGTLRDISNKRQFVNTAFSTDKAEDTAHRNALVKSAQKIKDAEEAFLALGNP